MTRILKDNEIQDLIKEEKTIKLTFGVVTNNV